MAIDLPTVLILSSKILGLKPRPFDLAQGKPSRAALQYNGREWLNWLTKPKLVSLPKTPIELEFWRWDAPLQPVKRV
ncbi:hypothetical protein [Baaleninema simplex]|uniref:hypothetical protein n=1 Tax=Baaleninema simplex TaxID=2862350 RepID=UPI00034D4479|nr:hypothetical protein [Baaleninema simplex]